MLETGSSSNLAKLVQEHYELVYRYAYRLCGRRADAEDLAQQTFLIAGQKYHQLRQPEKQRSWLCTIVRNLYLKSLRQQAATTTVSLDEQSLQDPHGDEVHTSVHDELQNALDSLPEEFRTPVILYYFEEFSYREIAEQLDLPPGTVMSRLARAKTKLREHLAKHEGWSVEAAVKDAHL